MTQLLFSRQCAYGNTHYKPECERSRAIVAICKQRVLTFEQLQVLHRANFKIKEKTEKTVLTIENSLA